jgi:hypothetical protein
MKFKDLLKESADIDSIVDEIISAGPQSQNFFFKSLQKIYNSLSKSKNVVQTGQD